MLPFSSIVAFSISACVVEKRKDIFGTAWYQAEHASYERGVKGFRIIKWSGNVAINKFKTVPKNSPQKCMICGGSSEAGYPSDVEGIIANRGERGFMKNFMVKRDGANSF
jgi:hypothetical protein